MLRRKTNELWTDNHRNVVEKLVVEEGWVQKRLYDIRWSNEEKCRGCNNEEGTEARAVPLSVMEGSPWEQRAMTSTEDWTWQLRCDVASSGWEPLVDLLVDDMRGRLNGPCGGPFQGPFISFCTVHGSKVYMVT